ncbi:MAG TPA: hypothetical protein VGH28_10430 [Polyangiaceae bacterium]|jgi:hypothetical protein
MTTKREMLGYLDQVLEDIRSRGLVANGITRSRLRDGFRLTTAIRAAVIQYVPNDPAPAEQPALKGVG